MISRYTSVIILFFILKSNIYAACGGPIFNSTYLGHCPNGTPTAILGGYINADTVTTYLTATDTINFDLQANSDCPTFDSIQWYKDGIFLYQLPYSSSMSYSFTAIGPGTYTCKFKMGAWISYSIFFPSSTSVNISSQALPTFSFYPNPSTGLLNIEVPSPGNYTLGICDRAGRVITNISDNKEKISLDLTDLNPGFYFIFITDDKGRRTSKKLIKS